MRKINLIIRQLNLSSYTHTNYSGFPNSWIQCVYMATKKPFIGISESGIALLTKWEGGHHLKPYNDGYGTWTISVGITAYPTTGKAVKRTDKSITLAESRVMFRAKLREYELAVHNMIKVDINQDQRDALISLCYNIGPGGPNPKIAGFYDSKVRALVNRGVMDFEEIQAAFLRHIYSGGKRSEGLIKRRLREVDLYFKNIG